MKPSYLKPKKYLYNHRIYNKVNIEQLIKHTFYFTYNEIFHGI